MVTPADMKAHLATLSEEERAALKAALAEPTDPPEPIDDPDPDVIEEIKALKAKAAEHDGLLALLAPLVPKPKPAGKPKVSSLGTFFEATFGKPTPKAP